MVLYKIRPFLYSPIPISGRSGRRHPYASLQEIGAMKMSAINTRKEMKDCWDSNELIQKYNLTDLIQWGHRQGDPYVLTEKLYFRKF